MKEFWVVYDYGMGGAWGIALASSEAEVTRVFPKLQVTHEKPDWMTDEIEDRLSLNSRFIVSDPTTYPQWVRTLISEREQ